MSDTECPVCGHTDIDGGPVQIDDGTAWQECTCNSCGASWDNVYKFVSCEDIEENK